MALKKFENFESISEQPVNLYDIGDYVILNKDDNCFGKIIEMRDIPKVPVIFTFGYKALGITQSYKLGKKNKKIYKLEYYNSDGSIDNVWFNEDEIYKKLTLDEVEIYKALRASKKYDL